MFKRITYLALALMLLASAARADMRAYLSFATFYSPENGPYIETYITIVGNSVDYAKNDDGTQQAAVAVAMSFEQNDSIRYFNKYLLLSPAAEGKKKANFLDQQRVSLPNGRYILSIELTDTVNRKNHIESQVVVDLHYPTGLPSVSDVELVDTYQETQGTNNMLSKSGYDLVPYASDFYPETSNKLTFYAELYNVNQQVPAGEKYLVKYFLESFETGLPVKGYSRFQRQTSAPVSVLFAEFPIDKLFSGNYNLVIELRDQKNELIVSKKKFIQRNNPNAAVNLQEIEVIDISNSFASLITSKDTLEDYIYSLRPISSMHEVTFAENVVKRGDLLMMQKFFYNFWVNRNQSDPTTAWHMYNVEVQKCNKLYSSFAMRGYETDRGRVYLQYGKPNSVILQDNEPAAYPYEIWHYYKIKGQQNRSFVFWNRDLVTNDWELLHSNVRGELYNSRWERDLYSRTNAPGSVDDNDATDHVGGRAREFFRNPR